MLKSISNLGTVLNREDQRSIRGGDSNICSRNRDGFTIGVYYSETSGYYVVGNDGRGPLRINLESMEDAYSWC